MEVRYMERWQSVERVPAPAIVPEYGGLSGMRVLMTGSVVAAPFAASFMAEHGAEVIHVERPKIGDAFVVRHRLSPMARTERSLIWQARKRLLTKRSVPVGFRRVGIN